MTVPILIGMNLSPGWVDYLEQSGGTATHGSQVGDPRAKDSEIMQWAAANGRTILTHDLDFGALLALARASGPNVIQLRGSDVLPDVAGPAVLAALARFLQELAAGALVTVDIGRQRVRLLPLR